MARKATDVELIISAKNESEKAFKSVADSLKEIEAAAKKGGGLAQLFQGSEARLTEVSSRQKEFNRLISDTKPIQKAIDTANEFTGAVKAQEAAVASAQGRLSDLESTYGDVQRAATAARQPSERLVKTLAEQKERQASLAESITETRQEIERSNAALVENAGLDEKAAAAVKKQRAAVTAAGQAWRETTQTIADAKREIAALGAQRTNISAAITTSGTNRSELEAELRTLKEFIRESEKLNRTGGGTGEATKALAKNARARLVEVESLLKTERQLQASLNNDLSKTTAAIRRQEQASEKLTTKAGAQKKVYDDLKRSFSQFEAASKTEGSLRQQKNIDRLNGKLERLQQNYEQTTQRVDAASTAISEAASPDPRAVAQLEALRQKIEGAREAVAHEQVELDKLNRELLEAGVSTDVLAQRQKELDSITERLTAEEARLAQELKQVDAQAKRTGSSVKQTSTNFLQLGNDTRQSLSYLQRIRGELLSIAATYTGLYAVGGAIRSIYDASVQLNKAQARFSVFFNGDEKRVAEEIEFVTKTAKDLKIEVEGTLDQYSKFVSGLDESQIPLDQIRKTFIGFATASRVGRLSAEETERVFNALTQIFGKQQLQTEELKGQLADALPGAVKRTADALKLGEDGVAKLTKAMEEGNVSSEAAILLANELYKVYGTQLPIALKGPDAALADFKNALRDVRLEVANSGFIEELTNGLREITKEFSSPHFKEEVKIFTAGLISLIKLAVEGVKHIELLAKALVTIYGVKVIGNIVKWSAAVNDVGKAVEAAGVAASAANKPIGLLTRGVGLLIRALGLLPAAAAAGFAFGTWLQSEFPLVQKFGVTLVAVFEKARISISAVWDKLVITLKGGFSNFLKQVATSLHNFSIEISKTLIDQFGFVIPDSFEKKLKDIADGPKIKGPNQEQFKFIDDKAKSDMEELDKIIVDMFSTIDANANKSLINTEQTKKDLEVLNKDVQSLFTEAEEKVLLEKAKGDGKTENKEALDKLREKVKGALADIDTEIQKRSGDTLQQRLDAISGQYRKLLEQIQEAGGAAQFPGASSIDQIVAIKQVEETEKEINNLIQERRQLISNINEQAELGSITVEEATKRINDENARLIPQMTAALTQARQIASSINSKPITQSVNAQAELVTLEQQRAKKEQLLALESEINRVMSIRAERINTINNLVDIGSETEYSARKKILDINRETKDELDVIIRQAIILAEKLGDKALIERLTQVNDQLAKTKDYIIEADDFDQQFASGLTDGIDNFISGTQSASDALRQFFADMLRWLARSILQWTILKAIQNSGWGGAVSGAFSPSMNHTGGIVGMTVRKRQVPIAAFAGAVRYHSGGIAGLKQNEVPTILEKGEEVLTRNDPRHRMNGGGGNDRMQVKIVNTIDSNSVLSEALNSAAGQKVLVNAIRANKTSVKSVLT